MADADTTVYTPDSPIGEAILGKKVGDELTYEAPNGREFEVKILDVKNYTG
jgi:transcription elongation factor GreA